MLNHKMNIKEQNATTPPVEWDICATYTNDMSQYNVIPSIQCLALMAAVAVTLSPTLTVLPVHCM